MPDAPVAPPVDLRVNNSPLSRPINPDAQRLAAAQPKVTPDSPEWANLTTDQRHAQLRGPENPRSRGYSPARDQREAAAAARAAGEAPSDDKQAPSATDTGEKFKVGQYEVSEKEVGELMADKAARDLSRTQIPAEPKLYKLELPEGAKLPGDATITFGNDPESLAMIEAAQTWAHNKGLSQREFSELLSIQAHSLAAQEMKIATSARAELDKLGANGPQRIDALARLIISEVGNQDARPIISTLVTDAHIRFFEKMFQKITSQGVASFSQQHRVAPDDKSIPGFDKMSFEQKRFAQDQRGNRR